MVTQKLSIRDHLTLLKTNSLIQADVLDRYHFSDFETSVIKETLPALLEIRNDPDIFLEKPWSIELLLDAIRKNYIIYFRYLFRDFYSINTYDVDLLMRYAFIFDRLKIVKLLSSKFKIKINVVSKFNVSDPDIPNMPIKTKFTLLEEAALRGHIDILDFYFYEDDYILKNYL